MWFLLLATLTVQLPGLLIGPITSDDAWRYVWDGRVQLAGIDPYRYAPLDPALAFLRDAVLFPPDGGTHINRPTVPTLYPPVGQLWFTFWSWVTPWSWGTLGVQLGAVLAVLVTTALLARFLGRNRSWALLYGACPAVAVEAASAAHLDAVAALCLLGFGWAAARARHWWAGLFLGLAAGLKLVPLLLIPALLRRGRWRTSLTAVTVVIGGYVPHVLAVGALIWGYLPGYWQEEGYQGDGRFALLGWLPADASDGCSAGDRSRAGRAGAGPIRSGTRPHHLLLAVRRSVPRRHPDLSLVRARLRRAGADGRPARVAGDMAGDVRLGGVLRGTLGEGAALRARAGGGRDGRSHLSAPKVGGRDRGRRAPGDGCGAAGSTRLTEGRSAHRAHPVQ